MCNVHILRTTCTLMLIPFVPLAQIQKPKSDHMKEKFLKQLFNKSKLILVFERKKHFDDFLVNCTFFPNISLPFIFLQQKSRDVLLGIFFLGKKLQSPPKGCQVSIHANFVLLLLSKSHMRNLRQENGGLMRSFSALKFAKKILHT